MTTFRRIYAARDKAARQWKNQGGTVVGYFCDNVPTELIHAAGCMPYRISGDPDADLGVVRDRIDALYTPDLTGRPGFVSSMLSQLVSGALDFVDYLIIPHNRHAIQVIFRELIEASAEDPSLKLPTLHYLDKAWSPGSEDFNLAAVRGLRDALREWTGHPLDDAAMADAIASAAAARDTIRRISAARIDRPSSLLGSEALHAYAAAAYLPPAEFQAAAGALLDHARERPPREGPRLFLGGSPFDHDRLYRIIEEIGANVVAEDHCWGARLGDEHDLADAAPLERLAHRFHHAPACSIRLTFEATVEASVARAVAAGVDAAIHYVVKGDRVQSWETPDEVAALRARGIPVLHLAEQSYDCEPAEVLKARIGGFLAEIAQGRAA